MTFYALASEGLKFGLIEPGWPMLFQLANTFILYMFLRRFLFKPVTEFMQKREHEIKGNIDSAEKKNQEAEQLMSDYKERIKNVEAEGKAIIRHATDKAEGRSMDIIRETEEHLDELKRNATKDIEREKIRAMHHIKDDISKLAILAATKVIEADLTEEKHRILAEKYIDEVGDTRWQN
jgi:F-type H+-transporting ATPase subunit b